MQMESIVCPRSFDTDCNMPDIPKTYRLEKMDDSFDVRQNTAQQLLKVMLNLDSELMSEFSQCMAKFQKVQGSSSDATGASIPFLMLATGNYKAADFEYNFDGGSKRKLRSSKRRSKRRSKKRAM